MYSKKFDNVTKLLQSFVDNGEIVGTSVCVIKANKEIYRENIGFANKEKEIAIQNDTIYRLFSMTKPVTAVAIMILCERGLCDINEPVSKYIPAYKNQQVMTNSGPVALKRELKIKDLLTMTSGLPYAENITASGMEMNKIFSKMSSDMEKGILWSTQKFIEAFANVPLVFQPGEHWLYGVSADIVGAIVEIISKKTFWEFLFEEIFEPLDMVDTSFWVPKEKRERFAQIYEFDKDGVLVPFNKKVLGLNNYLTPPAFESGGAGLVSTMDDYIKFASMLLNEGTFNCKKILSKKSVKLMSSNHLTPEQIKTLPWESQKGYGYGLLMRSLINVNDTGCLGSVGEYGWSGWAGNWFCIDPEEKLIIIFMMQRAPGNSDNFVKKLKNTVYSTIE